MLFLISKIYCTSEVEDKKTNFGIIDSSKEVSFGVELYLHRLRNLFFSFLQSTGMIIALEIKQYGNLFLKKFSHFLPYIELENT